MEVTSSMDASSDSLLEESKSSSRATWTKEQDTFLQGIVETYGTREWNIIADNMNNKYKNTPKSADQCRIRWKKHVHQTMVKHHWTEKEEVELLLAHMRYSNRWSDISNALHGRNNNAIKNRFYTIFRKVKNKVKRGDFAFTSRLELLQIRYMLSVMEDYMSATITPELIAAKAGKDFTYKLVQHIDKSTLLAYKKHFAELTSSNGSIQELFHELLQSPEPALIVMPDESNEEEKEKKPEQLSEKPSETIPDVLMIEEPLSGEDMLAISYNSKECTPLEGMILKSPESIPKASPCILSAGPAAAAAAASNAPCFQASPDDVGFSEFTEGTHWLDSSRIGAQYMATVTTATAFQGVYNGQVSSQQFLMVPAPNNTMGVTNIML